MEKNDENRWVADRLAELDPVWEPDLARGREQLRAGLATPARSSSWIATAAVAVICVAAAALPQTRAYAQQLWSHYVLNRIDVVRLDFSDLPLHARMTAGGPPQAAEDLDDAIVEFLTARHLGTQVAGTVFTT